jgi:hypothetical protein
MTDQDQTLETNQVSLSMEEILRGKVAEEKEPASTPKGTEEQTKAEDTNSEPKTQEPKTDPEVEKLNKRLQDTQKWGNTQREATLRIIKNLRDKGLSDEDISETVGGKEVFDKILRGVPAEQELGDKNTVVTQVYNQQVDTVAAAMMEMGHAKEELEEYVAAFNALASTQSEHRDELYRRATSGEGNVAAYIFKVGKEVRDDYRLSKEIQTKGVKSFEQELRERIKAELQAEMQKTRDEVAEELGRPTGKPRLVGGSTTTKNNDDEQAPSDFKNILGR